MNWYWYVDIYSMIYHFYLRVQTWRGEKLILKYWISLVDQFMHKPFAENQDVVRIQSKSLKVSMSEWSL